ncbi:MAG: DUF4062 domain-containing protein [Kineosporiaceae bacterium]|nr:DUF4062 domain-containing protein [Kineosporiaceae bacterium]
MRIFVSSTSRDLAEYRAAAIRGLRRLGHTVVAMEDFTAAPAYPLSRVVELVRASDAYVVIVAWRYGFPPVTEDVADLPVVPAGRAGISITEWEYLAAKEDPDRPILPFLLAETAPWQPQDIDGFDDHHGADTTIDQVRTFRATLAREHIVSFFSRPDELEALVTAAVTSARLARGVFLNQFSLGTPIQGPETTPDASYPGRIVDIVRHRGGESVAHVNIASPWWSTRLYLLAFLLDRLTATRRILVTDDAGSSGCSRSARCSAGWPHCTTGSGSSRPRNGDARRPSRTSSAKPRRSSNCSNRASDRAGRTARRAQRPGRAPSPSRRRRRSTSPRPICDGGSKIPS